MLRAVRETPAYAAGPAPPRTAGRSVVPSLRAGAGVLAGALGTGAMGAAAGLCTVIVAAAAERPSFLSGPAERGFPGWMVGPLAHRFGSLPPSPPAMQAGDRKSVV